MKASQALSSEMVLPKLIEKLVRIAVEHAGAERGLLVLVLNGEPRIEAEATTGRGGIEVVVRQAAVMPSDLPASASPASAHAGSSRDRGPVSLSASFRQAVFEPRFLTWLSTISESSIFSQRRDSLFE